MKAYGASVVGEKAAAAALVAQKKGSQYGPRVLGSSVDQSQEAQERRSALSDRDHVNRLPPENAGLDALVTKYATDDGYLAIKDVKTILADMPEAFDRVLGWEMGREDGPRIGALAHFIEVETARAKGARPTILGQLEKALIAVRTKNKG